MKMEDLRHIQSVSDILNTLEHLGQEEKIIQQEIDLLLMKENETESLITSLVKNLSNISLIENDTERLSNLMNFTSAMADDVSFKIRSFDLVKNRVSECLKQVEDIIDLRSCTDGIQQALANENYEDAARHIYRFLSMDETMLRKTALEEMNGNAEMPDTCSLEQSFVKLHEAEQNLKSIVMTRFDEAVAHKDSASIERFFKIFPLIKQHKQGLDRFSNYLWSQIYEEFENRKINSATKSSITLAKLSNLFETIAQKIDVYYPLIETYYAPGSLFAVVKILQKECDLLSKSLIEGFQNDKTFSTLISNVTRAINNMANQNMNKIDPKVVDKHINDIVSIINRSQTYLNFISKRLMDDIEAAPNDKNMDKKVNDDRSWQADSKDIETLIRDCTLALITHDLNSIYVLLEEYFLKESIQKAIQLDTIDIESKDNTIITSSMLDDIFFIIKNCLKRSILCGSINVILAIINHCVIVLETIFYEVIHDLIKCGYPNTLSTLDLTNAYNALQAGRYLQSSTDMEKMRISFICSLNNLDIACDYINKLCNNITDDVTKSGIVQKNQIEFFDSCLSNFTSLNNKFLQLITTGTQQLFSSVFKSIVKTMIDSFASTNHILKDEDVIAYEVNDGLRSFMQTFLMNINSTLLPFKKQLTEKNLNVLLGIIAGETSNRLYKALLKCTFNKVSHQYIFY